MSDLQPGVRHEAQESSLGNPAAAGAGLQLMAVLDQLHDDQAVYLDNLDAGVILRVLTRVSAGVRHVLAIRKMVVLTIWKGRSHFVNLSSHKQHLLIDSQQNCKIISVL